MTNTIKRLLTAAVAIAFILIAVMLGGAGTAFAASDEAKSSIEYLAYGGIFQGDENGNLNIDNGLTRAELAVLLTRLNVPESRQGALSDWYTESLYPKNVFTDVPAWALPHVNYCYANGLMNGVGGNRFDPSGQVNPKMACTVIMRQLKLPDADWNYDTSVTKANAIGLTKYANVSGTTITRGDMAIIIDRAINGHYTKTPTTTPTPASTTPEPTTTPSATTEMTIEEMKAEIVRLVNIEREKEGVPELKVSDALMNTAQLKADDMQENNYFSHTSPTYGTAQAMIKKYVGVTGDENAGQGQTTPEWVMYSWMNSSGHKKAILNTKYSHIGVGIAQSPTNGYYWVLHFANLDTLK
jgi:uncharacterized protein YkwD